MSETLVKKNKTYKARFITGPFVKIINYFKALFYRFDAKVDGHIRFFMKHWGKSKFMISMSKKAQVLGLEKLYNKGPKAFLYFFLFYLIRDTILYIIIPIFFAKVTTS